MQITLKELAALVGGQICGDGELVLTGVAPLAQAVQGQISLIDFRCECLPNLSNIQASAVITTPDANFDALPSIRVEDVHAAFCNGHRPFPSQAKKELPGHFVRRFDQCDGPNFQRGRDPSFRDDR